MNVFIFSYDWLLLTDLEIIVKEILNDFYGSQLIFWSVAHSKFLSE